MPVTVDHGSQPRQSPDDSPITVEDYLLSIVERIGKQRMRDFWSVPHNRSMGFVIDRQMAP